MYRQVPFRPGHRLCWGNLIEFDVQGEFAHSLCGRNHVKGAVCPSCDKPLILHVALDASDPSLNLGMFGVKSIPLLYCMRCEMHRDGFAYVLEAENTVRIAYFELGEKSDTEEWDQDVGKEYFPKRNISLTPIAPRLQEIYDTINQKRAYNSDENREAGILTKNYAPEEVGGHPYIGNVNQIGGRPFLHRSIDDPLCPICGGGRSKTPAYFLAGLDNDSSKRFQITFDGIHVCFFACVTCKAIICDNVVH